MRHDRVVSRYAIPICILSVDGWSMGPPSFGASHLSIGAYVYEYLGLGGQGSISWHLWCISCFVLNMLHDCVLCELYT